MTTAFEATVEKHQRRIFTFAYYFLADRQEAEDVTQEVLVRLWRHWPHLDPERVAAWLTRVTRNACFDLLRKRRSNGAGRNVELGEAGAAVADLGPGPEAHAASADFRRHLLEALGRLGEPYRSIVVLREVQGLAYQEISDALDLPLNTVRVYLHRARHRLRNELREVYEHAPT